MVGTRTRGRRRARTKALLFTLLAAIATVAAAGTAQAAPNAFVQRNLVSDLPGMAEVTDANLVNPWGLSAGPTTPMWVANKARRARARSTTARSAAARRHRAARRADRRRLPDGHGLQPDDGLPGDGGNVERTRRRFLFASLTGHITAWAPGSPTAQIAASADAVYTGLALSTIGKKSYLYAPTSTGASRRLERRVRPAMVARGVHRPRSRVGFLPFNVQALGSASMSRTPGRQASVRKGGHGLGYVDVYSRRACCSTG